MGRLSKYERYIGERALMAKIREEQDHGSVIQRREALPFKQENGGSNPSRPTINKLVAKKCDKCSQAMHIHRKDDTVIFAGCEPCIIDLRIERVGEDQALIKGRQSSKAVRCVNCHKKHTLRTFEEVKDGSGQGEAGAVS